MYVPRFKAFAMEERIGGRGLLLSPAVRKRR
jgi:hypothetical protein